MIQGRRASRVRPWLPSGRAFGAALATFWSRLRRCPGYLLVAPSALPWLPFGRAFGAALATFWSRLRRCGGQATRKLCLCPSIGAVTHELLRGGREDGEVGAHGAELRCTRDAQRQTTTIVADPHPQLILVRLRVVRRDRQRDRPHRTLSQLNRFTLLRRDRNRLRLVLNQHRYHAATTRRQIKTPDGVKE